MDAVILLGYWVVVAFKRTPDAFMALLAWCAVVLIADTSSDISTVYSFVSFAMLYILLAVSLPLTQAVIAGCIATYYLIFATDSWIYAQQQTWLWLHTEYIVTALHLSFMLSFSDTCRNMVAACRLRIRRYHAGVSDVVQPQGYSSRRKDQTGA